MVSVFTTLPRTFFFPSIPLHNPLNAFAKTQLPRFTKQHRKVAKRAYTKHANSTYYKQKSNHSKRAKKQQKQQTSIQCEQIIVKYGLILVWKPEKTEHQRHKDTKNEEVAPARTCNKTTHANLLNLPKKTIKHSTKPLQKMRQACTCTYNHKN